MRSKPHRDFLDVFAELARLSFGHISTQVWPGSEVQPQQIQCTVLYESHRSSESTSLRICVQHALTRFVRSMRWRASPGGMKKQCREIYVKGLPFATPQGSFACRHPREDFPEKRAQQARWVEERLLCLLRSVTPRSSSLCQRVVGRWYQQGGEWRRVRRIGDACLTALWHNNVCHAYTPRERST